VLAAERVARHAAERIAAQTRRLEAIGAQLSHRRTPREVGETILRESAGVLGQSTAAVWLLDATGTRLDMLASVGYDDPTRYSTFELAGDTPLANAVRTGKPIYIENFAEYAAGYPRSVVRLGDARPPELSSACLPLISEGRAIGGIAYALPRAHRFLADERTFIEVLASQCAQAIDRSRLLDQERVASKALAETNRTLNAVINASPAAIVIADLEGIVRLWNPAAEAMFGWRAADVLGKPWPIVEPSHRAEMTASLARIGRGESISGVETRRVRRNGTQVDVALWAAPIVRPDGEVQAIAVFVDITDRKRAEEAAREADQRKDEFFAMLGHELRNPLAPILTALELMRIRGEPGGERERAMIERQTRHLVRLVDDLLDISRITRGKIELRKTRVDLAAVIGHAVEAASPLLEQRGHHVSIAAPKGIVHVDGDEFRLVQIFQNLVTNAAKYTPSGGSIVLRMTSRDGLAITEIEDNGEGIAADVLPTIFEPFVQGARKIDRSQGGLGIGLALVRSLSERHGGDVEAFSEGPGRGSRFTVRLPLSTGAMRVLPRNPVGMIALLGAGRRLLLVDDHRHAAEMMAELLRAAGHEVVVAFDGPSALGSAPSFRPHVALLDIGLPVMDGYDLARKLRAALPSAPRLVAISGYGQEHDRRRSEEAGFEAHLVKPVQAAQVLAAVDGTPS
jgi:PAS domain S-box-containing protein